MVQFFFLFIPSVGGVGAEFGGGQRRYKFGEGRRGKKEVRLFLNFLHVFPAVLILPFFVLQRPLMAGGDPSRFGAGATGGKNKVRVFLIFSTILCYENIPIFLLFIDQCMVGGGNGGCGCGDGGRDVGRQGGRGTGELRRNRLRTY